MFVHRSLGRRWMKSLLAVACEEVGLRRPRSSSRLHFISPWQATLFRYETFAVRKYEAQASCAACIIKEMLFVSTPITPTGFFVFSSTNYPQKPPYEVSGKLSSTPKSCKVAHLLRFFGKSLCLHRRSFMRRRVTPDF